MRKAAFAALALLLAAAAPVAVSAASEAAADLNPEAPVARLAYVTETAAVSQVWLASATGTEPKLLGGGDQPLLAPNGQSVAVSLFGSKPGVRESGPSIGIYPATGAPATTYLSLETATATALAWSPDSRYVAVYRQSNEPALGVSASGLDVIDAQTGTVTSIAEGAIYGASFARDGSDRIVFGRSRSETFAGGVNLYESEPDGAGLRRLSSDGHSFNPVCGPRYIAYDRERNRKLSPEYQIWLRAPGAGAAARRVTHIAVDALSQGLVPLAFSGNGDRLLAEFEGEDNSEAYAVNVLSGQARRVTVKGQAVQGAGISSDGGTLLIDAGAFEQPPSHGAIATIPFGGGRPHVLVAHGSQGSWNR
jgi:hypothetical protein